MYIFVQYGVHIVVGCCDLFMPSGDRVMDKYYIITVIFIVLILLYTVFSGTQD